MPWLASANVYSGRPNPTWIINDAEARLLENNFDLTKGGADSERIGLGYRGFNVTLTKPGSLNESVASRNSLSSKVIGGFFAEEPELEERLLWTAGDAIDDNLRSYLSTQITKSSAALTDGIREDGGCPPCGGGDAPDYEPNLWNNDDVSRGQNNCYNYCNNQITNTFAQPGRGTGEQFTALECASVRKAASRDGLSRVSTFAASQPGWYVALVVWPDNDYHWYRQDTIGCWSHKPGSTAVVNYDNSFKKIRDPGDADRGPYTEFCGYFITKDTTIIA